LFAELFDLLIGQHMVDGIGNLRGHLLVLGDHADEQPLTEHADEEQDEALLAEKLGKEDESEEGHDTEALPDMNAEPEHRDEAQDKKLFAEMMGKMSDYDKERLKSGKPKSLGDRVKKAMMEEKA
jgi:hypothetical protein